jgi:hypothetical protein
MREGRVNLGHGESVGYPPWPDNDRHAFFWIVSTDCHPQIGAGSTTKGALSPKVESHGASSKMCRAAPKGPVVPRNLTALLPRLDQLPGSLSVHLTGEAGAAIRSSPRFTGTVTRSASGGMAQFYAANRFDS